jgi:hypothetical protein
MRIINEKAQETKEEVIDRMKDRSDKKRIKDVQAPEIKVLEDTYYAITSTDGIRLLKSMVGFNPQLRRLTWCRVQFKKDMWISVGMDVGRIKLALLQGKKLNINDMDKRWLDKMDIEISFTIGDSNTLHNRGEQELTIIGIIASDKIVKILKATRQDQEE